ncbi:MAG: PepSY-associated TM helix domain-containing protein [Marinifilaceae bacterium]
MKSWINIKWRISLRSLHRDLGYFFVGLTCIYAVSGLYLNMKKEGEDPAYSENVIKCDIQSNLTAKELKSSWQSLIPQAPELTRIIPYNNILRLYVKGGLGDYYPETGLLNLTVFKEKKLVKFINTIHYNQGKRFSWLANFFAISLVFFAVSGLFLVKGRMGFRKRGVWLMIGGILVPLVLYFL